MTNPVSIADIKARWRPLTTQENINAEAFLDDAWWLLLGRRPTLEDDIDDGLVTEGNVIRVVTSMVLRVLRNPDGLEEFAIDDFRGRRNALLASGLLEVTDDELADVTPGRRRRKSVRLVIYGDE